MRLAATGSKRIYLRTWWFSIFLGIFFVSNARGAGPKKSGYINWLEGSIVASGEAATSRSSLGLNDVTLETEGAAKLNAFRNVLQLLNGVHLTGSIRVGEFLSAKPLLRSQVEKKIRNFVVTETRYFADGSVSLLARIPLASITPLLHPTPPVSSSSRESQGAFTGIIVDARKTNTVPGLSPRLLDQRSRTVFDTANVARDILLREGCNGYRSSLSDAKLDERIGERPLVIRAIGVHTEASADLRLSAEDSTVVKENRHLLEKGRLIVVLRL